MSKFKYMNFHDGCVDTEFVVNAKKYTKEQAIKLCLRKNSWRFENLLRMPTFDDISLRYVRWYIRCPEWCGFDDGGLGCYTYCSKGERGSFPVWVIEFEKLKEWAE